ncbi:aminopeptidase P family protein [uncultured Alistipes sp.]|jgi:Xaa-Pro aminopeptidase|uniref:aminopeptidase P family protein n=1 Tax=uncultured Alistipes sp. TaxID=538949 RepID=UPI0025EA8B2C|nr:aminopeptidase P family protein [uncultured Alistipes sp.]
MFSAKTYTERRDTLRTKIGSGIILLPGNMLSPNNYLNNAYFFRQDSSFLYYFGLNLPSLVGFIDADSGEEILFGDDYTIEDTIWTGPQPTMRELGSDVGISTTFPMAELEARLRKAIALGRRIHYLPPYRGETKLQLSALLGIKPELLHDYKSVDLMFAVAEMREKKSAEEIEQLELAFEIGYRMHTLAMKMCRPGVIEREIAGAIEGIAKSYGAGLSFPAIVTQHGETLHNLNADGVLEEGRLLLCDSGGESINYYCSDHTRTYPVSGKFTQKQKDIYSIVLKAHDDVAQFIKPHIMYTEIHKKAYTILAEGLIGLGLMKGTAADAVESGAMTMFMPHGLGHGIGMDVHDCEAMGERSFDFSQIADRAAKSATCIYRATWRIEPWTVMSDEPGLYFIPALIDKCRAEGRYKGIVNYDALDAYRDFGGIRIEDDIIVTETGSRIIGGDKKIPITIEELEAVVGR